MIKAYRRHSAECGHKGRNYHRCSCPIWVDRVVEGKRRLKSLKTRNWEAAQKKILKYQVGGKDEEHRTIFDATEAFVRDAEARGLRPASIYKYKLLFKQLNAFADDKGLTNITELDVDMLRKFRES